MSETKPSISMSPKGPFIVKGLERLTDAQDQPIETGRPVLALCRCGASKNKPLCDGTHSSVGFSGEKERTETFGTREFEGTELTVVDNVGFCCHNGACVDGAPEVFFRREGDVRVSAPDEADRQTIIDTIRKCPSGALAYRLEGELHDEYFSDPEIFISANGPLHVRGGITLNNPGGDPPVSSDHYALCRCGASKNKPFCDGTHKEIGFEG